MRRWPRSARSRHRLVTTKYNPARTWTPENAVGIGGAYLCVYGMEGPGGYQFVGRTTQVWNHRHPLPTPGFDPKTLGYYAFSTRFGVVSGRCRRTAGYACRRRGGTRKCHAVHRHHVLPRRTPAIPRQQCRGHCRQTHPDGTDAEERRRWSLQGEFASGGTTTVQLPWNARGEGPHADRLQRIPGG